MDGVVRVGRFYSVRQVIKFWAEVSMRWVVKKSVGWLSNVLHHGQSQ
jgi:hypothetical protein